MKKNITINMFGQLFAIDEDAYSLLKNYLDSLRSYFRKNDGGNEIVNDIEARVCELFDDLRQSGVEAINIDHVEKIIKQIGNPEEMGGSAEAASTDAPMETDEATAAIMDETVYHENTESIETKSQRKKYYRDRDDKFVAGVLSGAARYFGGDTLVWRLGFIVLCLLWLRLGNFITFGFAPHLLPIFAYIAVAVLAPYARTPEDRLRMKGADVNPQNLADELSSEAKRREEAVKYGSGDSSARGCVNGFISVMGVLLKIFIIFIGTIMFVSFIGILCGLIALVMAPGSYIATHFFSDITLKIYNSSPWEFWILAVSSLVVLFIPTYCCIHSLMTSSGKAQRMGIGQRITWFALWLVAIVGCAFCSMRVFINSSEELHDLDKHLKIEYVEDGDEDSDDEYYDDDELYDEEGEDDDEDTATVVTTDSANAVRMVDSLLKKKNRDVSIKVGDMGVTLSVKTK